MSNYLTDRAAALRRDEGGQVAIAMILSLIGVLTLFALALDAGLWFFDHRTAQNQADAAALAAAQFLPASVKPPIPSKVTQPATNANEAAYSSLEWNGSKWNQLCDQIKARITPSGPESAPLYGEGLCAASLPGHLRLVFRDLLG